jgi:RNA polymerase I-specific transcription initiation factor RRN3
LSTRTSAIQWVHNGIRALLWVAPLTAVTIVSVIAEHVPHKRMKLNRIRGFLDEILRISTYAPAIRDRILRIIVDRLIDIDVEIKIEDGHAVIVQEEDVDVFDMEDAHADTPSASKPAGVDEMADKLDVCMESLFEYLEKESLKSNENCDALFVTLLEIFENSILLTHRSKYTQFIIFFVARKSRKYCDDFTAKLINKVITNEVAPITRVSALAYVASFLGKFLMHVY